MSEKKVVDILDREIKVGQVVAYPVRKSSSMWMNHGVVSEVGDDYIVVRCDGGTRRSVVRSLDRVVIAREAA